MRSAGARPAPEGGGHRRCAGAAAEPATSLRCQSADDSCEGRAEGALGGGGRRPAPDRSLCGNAAIRICIRQPVAHARAAAAADGLLSRRGWAIVRGRRLLRAAGGRAVGSAPWQKIVATLAVIAALHLPGVHGQPRYLELNENPDFLNDVSFRAKP
jgi:hypothetical protein